MDAITVVVADTQLLFAEALAGALALQPDVEVLHHEASTGLDAIDAYVRLVPDVLVLDYWLGEMNGAAATRQVLERDPAARVLTLAWLCGPLQVREARASGVTGFVPKSVGLDELVAILRAIKDGFSVFPGKSPSAPLEWTEPDRSERVTTYLGLSAREVEVLQLSCEGKRRHEVAVELGIQDGTVKNHVHNILTKTGTRTLLEAVALARGEGLVRETGRRPGR